MFWRNSAQSLEQGVVIGFWEGDGRDGAELMGVEFVGGEEGDTADLLEEGQVAWEEADGGEQSDAFLAGEVSFGVGDEQLHIRNGIVAIENAGDVKRLDDDLGLGGVNVCAGGEWVKLLGQRLRVLNGGVARGFVEREFAEQQTILKEVQVFVCLAARPAEPVRAEWEQLHRPAGNAV